jgi:hypothetical protein
MVLMAEEELVELVRKVEYCEAWHLELNVSKTGHRIQLVKCLN